MYYKISQKFNAFLDRENAPLGIAQSTKMEPKLKWKLWWRMEMQSRCMKNKCKLCWLMDMQSRGMKNKWKLWWHMDMQSQGMKKNENYGGTWTCRVEA